MNDPFTRRLPDYMSYFIKNAMTPIMPQQYLARGEEQADGISKWEQMLGN